MNAKVVLNRNFSEIFGAGSPSPGPIKIEIPCYCPICDSRQAPAKNAAYRMLIDDVFSYGFIKLQCNACAKFYLTIYTIDCTEKTCEFYTYIPFNNSVFDDEIIARTSQRFIDIYNQALNSEQRGDYDLAAMGCRNALEILIKDFAIKDLKEDYETVKGLTLANQ